MENGMATFEGKGCAHTTTIQVMETATTVCEDCIKMGDTWVHLRLCLACGHVGCCDASKNKHATAHHKHTGHLLIRSIEPHENWVWCYSDADVVGFID
jgi:uncharacterized UBP type Zn finger protein